jgi:hypothetical protein
MYAVVTVLDAARQRAHVQSLHGALGEARAACAELGALHPERELTLVELHRPMAIGAVISPEHMALGLGVLSAPHVRLGSVPALGAAAVS